MLSQGQIQVRKIVFEFLPQYQEFKSRQERQVEIHWEEWHKLYEEVIKQFSCDPLITTDPITAHPLGNSSFSRYYIDWLWKNGTSKTLYDNYPEVQLDKYVHQNFGVVMLAFQGGAKSNSTISCLFGLAENKPLHNHNFFVEYYIKSGILKNGNGGYHRLLAHVLWGEPRIQPERMCIIEESTCDPALNKALLRINELLSKAHLYFKFKYYSDDEVTCIKDFVSEAALKEIEIINRFLIYQDETGKTDKYRYHMDLRRNEVDVYYLRFLLEEQRKIFGRSRIKTSYLNTIRNLKLSNQGITDFEQWLNHH